MLMAVAEGTCYLPLSYYRMHTANNPAEALTPRTRAECQQKKEGMKRLANKKVKKTTQKCVSASSKRSKAKKQNIKIKQTPRDNRRTYRWTIDWTSGRGKKHSRGRYFVRCTPEAGRPKQWRCVEPRCRAWRLVLAVTPRADFNYADVAVWWIYDPHCLSDRVFSLPPLDRPYLLS